MTTFQATSKAADAPDLEAMGLIGMQDLRFTGTTPKIMKGGRFQKNEEGDPKLEWGFEVLDEDGEVIYDAGDPIEVQVLTGVGFNIASKTVPGEVKLLKALCTKAEFENFLAGNGVKEENLKGRTVQGELFVKENGWPGVTSIVAARSRRARRPAVSADEE